MTWMVLVGSAVLCTGGWACAAQGALALARVLFALAIVLAAAGVAAAWSGR